MNIGPTSSDFFVAGGTLRPDAPSYVKRPADDELFNLALAGEYCYVLTPRQMGKSSLMVRTARRLQEREVRTAIVDLTGIGANVSAEQWYLGLIARLKSQLKLSVNPGEWWTRRAHLSAVQRFTDFLRDVILAEIEGPVIIFMDEIDTTLNLDFSDDFFAAIRFVYNARASYPAYKRLAFVFLGVAAPADLIKGPGRTPFNIGHRIDLREFTREDAQALQRGLQVVFPEQGENIFARIYHWTNGHPYLTQTLCMAAAERGDGHWTDERVDDLVERLFLSEEMHRETNLQFVRDKMLNHPRRRQLLALYRDVYEGKEIDDDERSATQNQLKLSGLIKAEGGCLRIRNEIYRGAFNLHWVEENMPTNWASIAASIAVLVALLAVGSLFYNFWVGSQFQRYITDFNQTDAPEERLVLLAKAFRLRGLFDPIDYDYRAREFFYGMSRKEQLALFNVNDVDASDLVVVIRGICVTLADLDGSGSTSRLLVEMAGALDDLDETEEVTNLRDEMNSWVEGRDLVRQNQYEDALLEYNRAIESNCANPATRYERARVLIELSEYRQALNDLEQILTIAERMSASLSKPPVPAIPEFTTPGQMRSAVKKLVDIHPALVGFLMNTSGSEYPRLRASILTPTPAHPSGQPPTHTPTPNPWEEEPNNWAFQANGPLTSGSDYYGYPNDEFDWFEIYLDTGGDVSISLTGHTGHGVQLQLYYQSPITESLVGFAFESPYEIEWAGEAGLYYVSIFTESNFNDEKPYTLQVTTPSYMSSTPSSVPSPTPTVYTPPLTPTVTPSLTPTVTPSLPSPVPPTPSPPELLAPAYGRTYKNPVVFEWRGSLSAGQAYQVTARHSRTGHTVQSGLLTDLRWSGILPPGEYGAWHWTVSVIRGESVLATSDEWMFWFDPKPQPTREGGGNGGNGEPTPANPPTPAHPD
jgi:tetratricopeptide (TPR) repeat protein